MTTKIGQVRQALGLVAKAPVSVVLARIQKLQDERCHQAEHHEKAIEWRVREQVKQEFAAQISTLRNLLGASESETVESAASRVRAAADLPSEAAWGHLHLQLLEASAAIKIATFRIKQDWEQRKATKASDTPSAFTARVRESLRNVFCRELTTEESQLTFAFAEEWARLAQRHSAATSSGTSSSDS